MQELEWTEAERKKLAWYREMTNAETPLHVVSLWCCNCWAKSQKNGTLSRVSYPGIICQHETTVEIVCMTCGSLVTRIRGCEEPDE